MKFLLSPSPLSFRRLNLVIGDAAFRAALLVQRCRIHQFTALAWTHVTAFDPLFSRITQIGSMAAQVFSVRQNLKVFYSVIRRVFVFVVDMFGGGQAPTQVLFHDPSGSHDAMALIMNVDTPPTALRSDVLIASFSRGNAVAMQELLHCGLRAAKFFCDFMLQLSDVGFCQPFGIKQLLKRRNILRGHMPIVIRFGFVYCADAHIVP